MKLRQRSHRPLMINILYLLYCKVTYDFRAHTIVLLAFTVLKTLKYKVEIHTELHFLYNIICLAVKLGCITMLI